MEIFLVCVPGLEPFLREEALEAGFKTPRIVPGGVVFEGGWSHVWRANLDLRGASRVLARIGSFPVSHLSQLDKKARAFPWGETLRKDVPVTVDATCRKSKIYHSGAAAQRIATAISEAFGAPVEDDADVTIKARIENDLCTLSIDTSGGLLHKRGAKQAMAKAPLRETMAALMLRACGYDGTGPVLDPMCGSGTFVIEAAEWAAGLRPGRARGFAFEDLASFDAKAWDDVKARPGLGKTATGLMAFGSDRDAGAIAAATANAARAGVSALTQFEQKPVSAIAPPLGPPGLVIMNPPYGLRIGEAKKLEALYITLGRVLRERFAGWRVGLLTGNAKLAQMTGLPWQDKPISLLHGGLRVGLYRARL